MGICSTCCGDRRELDIVAPWFLGTPSRRTRDDPQIPAQAKLGPLGQVIWPSSAAIAAAGRGGKEVNEVDQAKRWCDSLGGSLRVTHIYFWATLQALVLTQHPRFFFDSVFSFSSRHVFLCFFSLTIRHFSDTYSLSF
jgi:hypothetical protein